MKIVFLTRTLAYGGAERQLMVLASGLHAAGADVSVLLFEGDGAMVSALRDTGVPVHTFGRRSKRDLPAFMVRLTAHLRASRPDYLYSFLTTPNIVAAVAKPCLGGRTRVVWGIRETDIHAAPFSVRDVASRLEARLAPGADLIIANSHAGRARCVARGFPAQRLVVVPNGIDTEQFRPDADARVRLRREWNLPAGAPVIGMVGRLDPIKDHATFLRAAAIVAERAPDAHFLCVGSGNPAYRRSLEALAEELGLTARLRWAEGRSDVAAVYNALDVLALSSRSEGFPNVLAEAMACGVPCVATDVGDVGRLLETTGTLVPVADAPALARGLLATLGRTPSAETLRAQIEGRYSIPRLVDATLAAFQQRTAFAT